MSTIKKALTRKLFGKIPVWAVIVAAVGGLYLYRRHEANSSSSSAPIDPATGYPTGSPQDIAALAALQSQQSGADASYGGADGSGGSGGGDGSGGGSSPTSPAAAAAATTPASATIVTAPAAAAAPAAVAPPAVSRATTPASSSDFAAEATAVTAARTAVGEQLSFGGVVDTTTLASGSTLTEFGTGREVEQAPGKAAYVVRTSGPVTSLPAAGSKVRAAPAAAPARTAVSKKKAA